MFVLPYTIPGTGLCVAAIIAGAFAWPYLPELLPLVGYAVGALARLWLAAAFGAATVGPMLMAWRRRQDRLRWAREAAV